jgi:hypothetical protein
LTLPLSPCTLPLQISFYPSKFHFTPPDGDHKCLPQMFARNVCQPGSTSDRKPANPQRRPILDGIPWIGAKPTLGSSGGQSIAAARWSGHSRIQPHRPKTQTRQRRHLPSLEAVLDLSQTTDTPHRKCRYVFRDPAPQTENANAPAEASPLIGSRIGPKPNHRYPA